MQKKKKKCKEELKLFWEYAHVNILTLYERDKFRLPENLNIMTHLHIWLCFLIRKQGIVINNLIYLPVLGCLRL